MIAPHSPESVLPLATGLIGLWCCARSWLGDTAAAPAGARIGPGLFRGIVTGVASFITHSGAPPTPVYLLPQRLPRLDFAGTVAIALAVGNLAKVPGYEVLGQCNALDWPLTTGLVASGIAGTAAGRWIVGRLRDATCVRLIEALLLALSLILIWRGAAAALGA